MTSFFLNVDDLSVSSILACHQQCKRIFTHHCMPILQGLKCCKIVFHLWSWSCQLLGQKGKSSYSLCTKNDNHWWILMLFNKGWTLKQWWSFQPAYKNTKHPTKLPFCYVLCGHPDSTIQVLVECYLQSLTMPMGPKGRLPFI